MTTPTNTDITAGLDLNGFEPLTPAQLRVVYTLMARAAERSYRRGVQQGAHIQKTRPHTLPSDLHRWRYGMSTDASPWVDSNRVETAIERLETENRRLPHVLGPAPTSGGGVMPDFYDPVPVLVHLAREYQSAAENGVEAEAWQRLRALGIELHTIGGSTKMIDVYDDAIDQHGHDAVRGVLPVWDTIGGEYFS